MADKPTAATVTLKLRPTPKANATDSERANLVFILASIPLSESR